MKISEVSQQSGLTIDTLRYYEKVGLLPPIERTGGGIRDYSTSDVKRIDFIKCMRTAGLSIDTLIEYFALVEAGDDTVEARKEILQNQRSQLMVKLAEMEETLSLLNHKIRVYENVLLQKEKQLTA